MHEVSSGRESTLPKHAGAKPVRIIGGLAPERHCRLKP